MRIDKYHGLGAEQSSTGSFLDNLFSSYNTTKELEAQYKTAQAQGASNQALAMINAQIEAAKAADAERKTTLYLGGGLIALAALFLVVRQPSGAKRR